MPTKEANEEDWAYLERRLPEIYSALHRIKDLSEAFGELFEDSRTYWEGDDRVDLTNKTLLGLLQLEIEELAERIEKIEVGLETMQDKEEGWHIFGREENAVIFENSAQELYRIPVDLLDVIANLRSFDGQIRGDGRFVTYTKDGATLCRVPKGLVRSLIRKESPEDDAGGS